MGGVVIFTEGDIQNPVGFVEGHLQPPVDLDAWCFAMHSKAVAAHNYSGGQDFAVIGELAPGEADTLFQPGRYINSRVEDAPEITLISVARRSSPASAMIMGNYGGGGFTAMFLSDNGTNVRLAARASSMAAVLRADSMGAWTAAGDPLEVIITVVSGLTCTIHLPRTGQSWSGALTARGIGALPICFGHGPSPTGYTASFRAAGFGVARRALSAGERTSMYDWIKEHIPGVL